MQERSRHPVGLRSLIRRSQISEAVDLLGSPLFIIDASGAILEANEAGEALLVELLPQGRRGSLGAMELSLLLSRAAGRDLAPSPFALETAQGPLQVEARFGKADHRGRKTVILSDVTVWKRALAEKETMIRQFKMETERPIAVCARCGAVKEKDGTWGAAGGLEALRVEAERLSHGLCPACLAAELRHAGLGPSAISAALSQQAH